MTEHQPIYGLLAEFETSEQLIAAARQVHDEGFECVDAFTPFPIEELSDAIGFRKTKVPLIVLIGGVVGGALGYLLQWWINVRAYPINIGGKPHHSWPAFIPATFETTILLAALSAVLGMLALNGLPRPHHPLFEIEEFARASQDSYFLCVEASDTQFDESRVRTLLQSLQAKEVWDVPSVD